MIVVNKALKTYIESIIDDKIDVVKFSKSDLSKIIPYPFDLSNKYSRGMAAIVAGSDLYPGASLLASFAAVRSGSGYTKLFTSPANVVNARFKLIECPVESYTNINPNNVIFCSQERPSAYLVGPGFVPGSKESFSLAHAILSNTNAPVILDGGGLSTFSNEEIRKDVLMRSASSCVTVLTPHMGEAIAIAKAWNLDIANQDASFISPMKLARELSSETKCIVCLKGPVTFIDDGKKSYLMSLGTSALAKAGTGDVLAGILVGLICQNRLDYYDACVLGNVIHAVAGRLAQNELGSVSVCATDIIDFIPEAFKEFD